VRPPLKIAGINTLAYDAPFRLGYRSAHLLRMKADSVILAMSCDGNVTGYGESAPRPYVTGETAESVGSLIRTRFAPRLVGEEIETTGDAERLLGRLREDCRRYGIAAFRSAMGAVDIALLDALGKRQGIPVCHLLGPELRKEIAWSLPIPMLPEQEIRTLYGRLRSRTFSSVKVLVGRDETENLERVRLVRALVGDEFDLRLDANGQWSREEALSQLRKLRAFGIAAVEQPVAKEDMEGLRIVRETAGIPVIADESLCSPEDAEALLARGACDILNIKISKVGGLLAAYRIAELAASRGATCQLGAHVGETEILTAAALHFLSRAPALTLAEGFSSLLFRQADRIEDLDPGQRIRETFSACGLGIQPEEDLVRDRPDSDADRG